MEPLVSWVLLSFTASDPLTEVKETSSTSSSVVSAGGFSGRRPG